MDAHNAPALNRVAGENRPTGARRGPSRCGASRCAAISALGVALALASGCGQSGTLAAPPSGSAAEGITATEAGTSGEVIPPEQARTVTATMSGKQLYEIHCAACHGVQGDGNGPAATYLYPRPRNFKEGQFRLVTTTNQVPSDADLMRVIERGMPGSAMFPYGHLPEAEREALVAHVRALYRQGLEERMRREAEEFDEEIDPVELAEFLDSRTAPGPLLDVPPDLPKPEAESVARGQVLFARNCTACHGETGRGDGVQVQQDSAGMPIRPRDLTRGIFKGGRERDQLYARIMLGSPGTPMPASTLLTPVEVGDLINFILSLSDASAPSVAEHRRVRLLAHRSSGPLPEEPHALDWAPIPSTPIVVSPLWWRDYDGPDLRAQAIHDGRELAIRLSWRDASREGSAIRPQDFPDMAAVQLFKGQPEPFLGMGATGAPVDVWLWNAAAQADRERLADVDTTYPNMIVDLYPFEEPVDGPTTEADSAHPTTSQPREFLSAWAAGNPRSGPTRPLVGNHLEAIGFGSLTMRPTVSQVVLAEGRWEEGRWTIVLRRPLQITPDAGFPLAEGDRLSIAFALWDGAARDRGGQKLISIWHDLELEGGGAARTAPTPGARR